MTKKPIDPVAIKQAIKDGQLIVYKTRGSIYIRDGKAGDCVRIMTLEEPDPRLSAPIKSIRRYYEIAKNNDWIKHKVAWSLYQAWKDEDKKSKIKEEQTNG